ncbi:MAG: hypothetical protein EOO42_11795 [Flavobacteriales bacterium]|nr:MAG: hypothetical protein EOO42_11795 [Flavobacteriales bacterium]
MKKIFIYGLSILTLGTVVFGCMPKDDLTYQGPTVVEVKNHLFSRVATRQPAGVTANTFLSRTVSVNTRVTDTIYVQLVGAQIPAATEIPFTVTGTAVAGTHYNFRPAGNNKVTIPANSSTGFLLVDMVPGSVTGTATFPLNITLGANGQVAVSENYKTFTLTLRN